MVFLSKQKSCYDRGIVYTGENKKEKNTSRLSACETYTASNLLKRSLDSFYSKSEPQLCLSLKGSDLFPNFHQRGQFNG